MTDRSDWTKTEIDEMLDEYRPVTIPVNITIEGRQRILSLHEAERLLRGARIISLESCSCREKIKGCDAPLDVCVCMDDEAKEAMEERGAWQTTLEDAMEALMRAHKAGLVHLAYETKSNNRIEIICSCCTCCCQTLAAITRFGYHRDLIGHSDMVAVRDASLCNGCGTCVERCHFKAWSAVDGEVIQDAQRCAGCGVCASFCPEDAIKLAKRR